jgi:L-amino acid N-acyltransferase YncA
VVTLVDRLGTSFAIRDAAPADAPSLGAILAELAARDDFILLSPEEVPTDDLQRADDIARSLSMSERWFIEVVEVGGVVEGIIDVRAVPLQKCRHVAELGIGLRAGATDRGIGTALIRHAIRRATEAGFAKLRLFVIACNDRARHVYERSGFAETGRYHAEVSVGGRLEDLVVMERAL